MSLINKINFQYKFRLLKDLVDTKRYEDFFDELGKTKKNHDIFSELSSAFVSKLIKENEKDIFGSKLVWLNSFIIEDLLYLNDFITYYFNKQQKTVNPIKTYQEEIAEVFKNSKNNKDISFDDLLDNSYLYQWLILQNSDQKYNFINNQMPFFSTKNNFNFTKPTLTDCFIMIIDNPYNVYQTIKNQNDNDIEKSRNIFLNLDNRSTYFNLEKVTVEINRQGWQTNSKSWKDPNVLNSLRGKIILKSELIENTYETLSSIIFHFIQSGIKIEINYEIIQEFIKNNPISFKKIEQNISLKEKKFLDPYIDNIISDIERVN
tara:strand:+ start:175 stop:1131 length:957 start_codon:yes stop_codon:yes gene_type:complete